LERARLMRNLRTSKYKQPRYFVNQNGNEWEVVEFPTNDIVSTFCRKIDAELLSERLTKNKPFGDRPLPKFLKGNKHVDISE
jgi:hypothetical protein